MEIIQRNKVFFFISIPEIRENAVQEEMDTKWLESTKANMILEATGAANKNMVTPLGERKSINSSVVEDEKENFLMPAPRGRPPRNRKRNTKSTLEDVRISRSKRVTRSSKISKTVIDVEEEVAVYNETKKTRKTKTLANESLSTENIISPSALKLADTESSISGESSKGRRTTRKGKDKPTPRASRAMRASTRNSYKCRPSISGSRKSLGEKRKTKKKTSVLDDSSSVAEKRETRSKVANVSVNNSSFLGIETVVKKRVTRNRVANASAVLETETLNVVSVTKVLASPARNKNSQQTQSPAILFSPYAPNSVKQRVEAFEELSSTLVSEPSKGKNNELAILSVGKQASPSFISPIPKVIKSKVDSPMIKSKSKGVKKKVSPLHEESVKEQSYEDYRELEANIKDTVKKEPEEGVLVNKTYQVEDERDGAMETNEKEVLNNDDVVMQSEEDENEADDEWVSDDDRNEKKEKSPKKIDRVFSSTPKPVKIVEPKIVETTVGSYKALRSRKVKNASTDVPISLQVSKSKVSGNLVNNAASVTPIQQQKPVEIEMKEAELKKKMEKELEALKRKEEIMKKRTEAAKRKREEKMAKVKRTREEREKERSDAKAKVRKVRENKKQQVPAAEPEVEPVKTPAIMDAPKDFNATFEVKINKDHEVDSYNLTPCWQDKPPVQPDNPNDYGMVDKSDCSSEEDNDPRKKVPVWAQMKPNDSRLLSQALLPHAYLYEYWHCKPRTPTIKELFGLQVSKRTLQRGLNYRTSSACWNTPPARKLGLL